MKKFEICQILVLVWQGVVIGVGVWGLFWGCDWSWGS